MADEDILVDGRPLSSLKVTELKEELENRQLSTKGVKAVLQERLREALAAQGDDPVVDEQNPIVAGYLARQSAALAEARKRTESEASGTTTPQSEVSPSKQSEASPRKGRTPRKEKKDVEPEAEPEPEADIAPEPEKVAIVEKPEPKPEPITETEASPSKASEKDAAVEVSVEKVDAETAQESDSPQEAEKEKTEPQVELENGGQEEDEPDRDESIEKQPEKEDDGDELDYGDDEEKEQKDDESMDAEDAKEEKVVQIEKEKKEDKDDGVKKEEKVREVSRRRVSSPSSSSRHPVSNVVHIRGLTRPFTEGQLRAEIQKNCGEIVDLWMDKVKSHCFVKLNSDADAGNVISAMNNVVWPDGNPKRLSIVYDTEDNLIKHRNGLEATIAEPAKIGGGRADRLSTTSQSSILGGKTNFQITMQNVLRDNDKLDSERKRERGSIQSRLTRIENKDQVKDEKKDEKKEDRKRKRSETPPFSRGAGFMDEKKARNEERERRREGPRSEERRKVVVEEEEAPKKSLDQLFKKTVALPPIYYLPLTEEQIAAKEAEKSAKGKERAETTSDRDRPHRVDRNDRGDRPRHRD